MKLLKGLTAPLENGLDRRAYFKIFRVETDDETVSTSAYFQAAAKLPAGVVQQNATWTCSWTQEEAGQPPRLKSIAVSDYEEIRPRPIRRYRIWRLDHGGTWPDRLVSKAIGLRPGPLA